MIEEPGPTEGFGGRGDGPLQSVREAKVQDESETDGVSAGEGERGGRSKWSVGGRGEETSR